MEFLVHMEVTAIGGGPDVEAELREREAKRAANWPRPGGFFALKKPYKIDYSRLITAMVSVPWRSLQATNSSRLQYAGGRDRSQFAPVSHLGIQRPRA